MKSKSDRLDAAYSSDDPESMKALYRQWADTYDAEFASASDYQPAKLVADAYVHGGGVGPVLDVGCGTGLVAENLPGDFIVDGLDYSPEMLQVARRKALYRKLICADLNAALDLPSNAYSGFVSAGTFTIGHVGPGVISSILRHVKPGGHCVVSGNLVHFAQAGFASVMDRLREQGEISEPTLTQHKIYGRADGAPAGHADDKGFLLEFKRA